MKDVNEMTHEYAKQCLNRLGIYINEHLIPYTMKRDFDKEMEHIKNDFSIVEAFDCMEFEVTMAAMIIDLHDALCSKPILFFSTWQLENLLEEYVIYYKSTTKDIDDDELDEYDKSLIEKFAHKKIKRLGKEDMINV